MKVLQQMYLWTGKNWLNFGSHPPPDPDPGIFWRILQHCEIGHFSTVWLISPQNRIFLKILSHTYPWTRKSRSILEVIRIQSPDPESISGYGLRIQIVLLGRRMRSPTTVVWWFGGRRHAPRWLPGRTNFRFRLLLSLSFLNILQYFVLLGVFALAMCCVLSQTINNSKSKNCVRLTCKVHFAAASYTRIMRIQQT